MKDLSFSEAYNTNFIASWSSTIPNIRKPVIAAVNGHALGGGCELALMTDIIYCSSTATFGQPEIKLGIIPGAGGSQRLTKIIGKSRAMNLILTGRNFSGLEAERWGVAARCFENAEECLKGALETAERIAGMSRVAVRAAKEVVNKSQDLGIREGVEYERKVFHGLFGSRDQKIGTFLHAACYFQAVREKLTASFRYECFCEEREARMGSRIAIQFFHVPNRRDTQIFNTTLSLSSLTISSSLVINSGMSHVTLTYLPLNHPLFLLVKNWSVSPANSAVSTNT